MSGRFPRLSHLLIDLNVGTVGSPETLPHVSPSLGCLQGLPLKGALAFCADFSVQLATVSTYWWGAQQAPPLLLPTENLQSSVSPPKGSVYLESPDCVSIHPSLAEVGFCPRGCCSAGARGLLGVRWALAFVGGPTWPLLSLSSHWLWVMFPSLQFGGSPRAHKFSGPPGFNAAPR